MLFRSDSGTTTDHCKTVARVRRRIWPPSCDWNLMSCFRLERATRLGTIESRKHRQSKPDELLTVLSEPSVPLHNNASELAARVSARRRDVSLHSRSARGVRAMDIFTTRVQTSKQLGCSASAYLRDRLSGCFEFPSLASSISPAAASGAEATSLRLNRFHRSRTGKSVACASDVRPRVRSDHVQHSGEPGPVPPSLLW
jgi:hypothetical protein